MNPEKHHTLAPPIIAAPEPVSLDIDDPAKWQMKIRLYLESLSVQEAETWMGGLRLITAMAGRVVRDQVYNRVTRRCIICDKPLKEGRPAGDAGYYDADREWIKVYICDQSEYADMLKYCARKEDEIARLAEKAEAAAKQAAKDARSKVMRA